MSHLPTYQAQNYTNCISLPTEFEGIIGTVVSADDQQPVYRDFLQLWKGVYGVNSMPPVSSAFLIEPPVKRTYN